jgi:hypothetical protein
MASITIHFTNPLNASCQVGDFAYAATTETRGGFTVNVQDNLVEIGQIREINNPTSNTPSIICSTGLGATIPDDSFILFAKSEKANMSSLLGYYAETKFVCDDEDKAELFSIGTETFESSK